MQRKHRGSAMMGNLLLALLISASGGWLGDLAYAQYHWDPLLFGEAGSVVIGAIVGGLVAAFVCSYLQMRFEATR